MFFPRALVLARIDKAGVSWQSPPLSPRAMSSRADFKQESHKLLVIPGPIEVSDDVLYANAHPSTSHIAPDFIPVLGDCIRMTKEILHAPDCQPFLISGSGTLGWDQAAANLIEPGDEVLVFTTGYFGDSFADCLDSYGAKVTQVTASPVGAAFTQQEIEQAVKGLGTKFKAVTFTHVDTSTGVLNDAKMISETVKRLSPESLVFADCVCSVASEQIRQSEWGIDIVLSASQKGVGAPPGLSILSASPRAIKVYESRKSKVTAYYASWRKWLPIMKAYENGTAAYFATPPTNLVYAVHAAMTAITKQSPSLEERLKLHQEASKKVRQTCLDLGLKLVPTDPKWAANGMTTVYAPDGIAASDIVGAMGKKGVIIAGGLHKDIKTKYFRIGHMGVSVVQRNRGDVDAILSALKDSLKELGHKST